MFGGCKAKNVRNPNAICRSISQTLQPVCQFAGRASCIYSGGIAIKEGKIHADYLRGRDAIYLSG